MKKLFFLLLQISLISCVSIAQSSMQEQSKLLLVNQSITLNDSTFTPAVDKGIEIQKKYVKQLLSNPILKTMGIDKCPSNEWGNRRTQNSVPESFADIISSEIICSGCSPYRRQGLYPTDERYYQSTYKFLHKAIKNKKIRELSVEILGNMLVDLCKYYPKDFRQKVLRTLNSTQNFVNDMYKHKYEIIGAGNSLFVDGYQDRDLSFTIEGFIIRRVVTDKVPKEEIKGYLTKLITKLQAIDTSENKDILSIIEINNRLKCCLSCSEFYFVINNKKIRIKEFDNHKYRWDVFDHYFNGGYPCVDYNGTPPLDMNITYLQDNDNHTFYSIEFECIKIDNFRCIDKKLLISNDGEIVYEE